VGHLFVFQGDKFHTPEDEMRFQLDPEKKPKQFDATGKSAPEGFPPIGMMGIYKLEGDKLTLCYAPLRKDARRPTEFKTVEGRREALVVLERVKVKKYLLHAKLHPTGVERPAPGIVYPVEAGPTGAVMNHEHGV